MLNLILCHLIGDYVLQNDFIAKTKGENLYHLLVHCLLYILPFYIMYGFDYKLLAICVIHFIVDLSKAKYRVINYIEDQLIHYAVLFLYYVVM